MKTHIPLERMTGVRDHLIPRQGSHSGLLSVSSAERLSDPFSRWTSLEDYLRTILLPSAKKAVRKMIKKIEKQDKIDNEDKKTTQEGNSEETADQKDKSKHVCPESNETT